MTRVIPGLTFADAPESKELRDGPTRHAPTAHSAPRHDCIKTGRATMHHSH